MSRWRDQDAPWCWAHYRLGRLLLKSEGMANIAVDGPVSALEAARKREFACALIDLNYARDTTSGEEGLELLEHLRQLAPELPVVVMAAWGNVPLAMEAMRRGAEIQTRKRHGQLFLAKLEYPLVLPLNTWIEHGYLDKD